jgi:hypothetical protein
LMRSSTAATNYPRKRHSGIVDGQAFGLPGRGVWEGLGEMQVTVSNPAVLKNVGFTIKALYIISMFRVRNSIMILSY